MERSTSSISRVRICPGPPALSGAMESLDRALFGGAGNSEAFLPDTRQPSWMDGQGSGPEAMARRSRQAVPGNRHKDRQVQSIRSRARLARHPPGGRGAVAVLGPNRPGSEGNLASNNDNINPGRKHPATGKDRKAHRKTGRKPSREIAAAVRDAANAGTDAESPRPAEKEKLEASERPERAERPVRAERPERDRAPIRPVIATPPPPPPPHRATARPLRQSRRKPNRSWKPGRPRLSRRRPDRRSSPPPNRRPLRPAA